jgi:hypothetical protein
MAKLFVPAGSPFQVRAGDWFGPLHPKSRPTNSAPTGFPTGRSGLVKLNEPFANALSTQNKTDSIKILLNIFFTF